MAEVIGIIASVIALCETAYKGGKFIAEARGAPNAYVQLQDEVPNQPDLMNGVDGRTSLLLATLN